MGRGKAERGNVGGRDEVPVRGQFRRQPLNRMTDYWRDRGQTPNNHPKARQDGTAMHIDIPRSDCAVSTVGLHCKAMLCA